MAITPSELLLIIKAKDQATATLKNLSGESKSLDKNMGSLGKSIQNSLSGLVGGGFGSILAGGAVAGGLALIAKQAISAAGELAELGRESEVVGTSFRRIWGSEAPSAMNALRDASKGAITDVNLMLAANKAQFLGVGSSIDDLVGLMQVARERGQAMGLTTTQAFNDIVTGIGRMSPMILDNLGIVMDAETTYATYAASIGKTAKELTDLEKKQALVNRVTEQATDVAVSSAEAHAALQTAKQNLRTELGLLIDAFIEETGVVETLTARLNKLRSAMEYERNASASVAEATERFNDVLSRSIEKAGMTERLYQRMEIGQRNLETALRDGRITADQYRDGLNRLEDELRAATGQMSVAEIAAADLREAQVRAMAASYQAAEAFRAAGVAAVNMGRDYSWAASMQLSAGEVYTGSSQYVYGMKSFGDRGAIDAYLAYYKQQREYAQDTASAEASIYKDRLSTQRSYAAESQRIAEQQYQAVRGIVESLLTPTEVTAEDLAAAAAGTYVDKWDEYIRRVRMVEKGNTPEYIAEQERLFYGGKLLDEVNWQPIIDEVRRKVEEEAGRQALIEEAMRQVRMAGITASDAQLSAAMGITDYQAMGADYGQQLAEGISATGLASMYTDNFETEFAQEQDRWRSMGVMGVEWMVEGISQAATQDAANTLIDVLVQRVAAALRDKLSSGGSGGQIGVVRELQALGVGF